MGSNSYINFGGGATNHTGLSASLPKYRSIMVGASDTSWAKVYTHNELATASARFRLRFEGYSSNAGGTSANVVWELSFYKNHTARLCIGATNAQIGKTGALSAVTSGAGKWLANYTLAANTLYTLDGLSTGLY